MFFENRCENEHVNYHKYSLKPNC